MRQYLELMEHVLTNGKKRQDRTGVGTIGVFGAQFRHSLEDGFPLLTTKRVHTKSVIHELLWFLSGSTNNNDLIKHGVTIWNEWAKPNGELGPIYSEQWVDGMWSDETGTPIIVNQILNLVNGLRDDPFSRRHIVSAWNVGQIDAMALPPCHTLWQCYVEECRSVRADKDTGYKMEHSTYKRLSLHLYARSIDLFLGLPFNIASYGFLLSMLAQVTGMTTGDLIISFGDLHIYQNHVDQCREQLRREPYYKLPTLTLNLNVNDMCKFAIDDFIIAGYEPQPAIKAPIAV